MICSRSAPVLLLLALLAASPGLSAEELNLFDWAARGPLVVAGTSRGENGRYVEFQVERALRGEMQPESILLVDLRTANRERDRWIDPKALRLEAGSRHVLLLEAAFLREKDQATIYRLVRGTRGARPLPAEGEAALLAALERFISIQDLESDNRRWRELTLMLEETDAGLLETALDEFLRYRRGSPELVPIVLPILDHPGPALREKAAKLAGQILGRHDSAPIPEKEALRAELIARARRDDSVEVRVAATDALRGFTAAEIAGVLEEIAADDPDQNVRYAAELILLDLGAEAPASREGATGPD